MSRTTLLALATVIGAAAAGCATGSADDPIVVAGRVDCSDVAQLLGLDLGNRELTIAAPVEPTYPLDDYLPVEVTLTPSDGRAHLEWSESLGVLGVILERTAGDRYELDHDPPLEVAIQPADRRAHLEWADQLGVLDTALAPVSELYLRDPAVTGGVLLPASLHPRTKWSHEWPPDLAAIRICYDR